MRTLLSLLLASVAAAGDEVTFQFSFDLTAQPERSLYLQGTPEALGSGTMNKALLMSSADRVNWSVIVELPHDEDYEYRFVHREVAQELIKEETNGERASEWMSGATSPHPDPERKTLVLYSDFDNPFLVWRDDPSKSFRRADLRPFGPGRVAGERRYVRPEISRTGREIAFYVESEDGTQRDPATGVYKTHLDEVHLQDGVLFAYSPAPVVSESRRDYQPNSPIPIVSNVLGVTRYYRVWLPRGYDEHPDRRYPVVYHYDGQFMWDGGVSYDEDGTRMSNLVDDSRLAETIQVGLDFEEIGNQTLARWYDCGSPEDVHQGQAGRADQYQQFLITELKPVIDATYRTRPEREWTFAQGYSFGGLFAMYAGWEHPDVYGGVAPQSGSFHKPNFTARVMSEAWRDVRIFLDTGDDEDIIFHAVTPLAANLLGKATPYVAEKTLRYMVGFNQGHSYKNGAKRLRRVGEFLFHANSVGDEVLLGDGYCVG